MPQIYGAWHLNAFNWLMTTIQEYYFFWNRPFHILALVKSIIKLYIAIIADDSHNISHQLTSSHMPWEGISVFILTD